MQPSLVRTITRLPFLTYWRKKVVSRRSLTFDSLHDDAGEKNWHADASLVDCLHYHPTTLNSGGNDDGVLYPVLVYPNVIDTKEQEQLEQTILSQSLRHRYQRGHWDAVILNYREFALDASCVTTSGASLNNILDPIFRGLAARHISHNNVASCDNSAADWLPPHVIDLKANGEIRPHVDSVRFSGDLVCGLSLLSPAIMRLSPVDEVDGLDAVSASTKSSGSAEAPKHPSGYIDVLLPPRSLYVLQGQGRYHMTHALRSSGSVFAPLNEIVTRQRRFSIILRDAKRHTAGHDE